MDGNKSSKVKFYYDKDDLIVKIDESFYTLKLKDNYNVNDFEREEHHKQIIKALMDILSPENAN